MKPFISLCMIVRDESKVLRKCLESVTGVVDEIIIVDTGSEDNTKEIAKEYTCNVFDYKWDNSFANARNYASTYAKGEWILVLDADEYVDRENLHEAIEEIKQKNNNYEVFSVNVVNYTGATGEVIIEHKPTRIYRNYIGLKFYRSIHEQLRNQDKSDITYGLSSLKVYHTGYLTKVVQEKNKRSRNMSLLQEELKYGRAFDFFNLGNELRQSGEYQDALEAYINAYDKKDNTSLDWVPFCLFYMTECLIDLARFDEALKVIVDAENLYNNTVDFTYLKGLMFLIQKRYDDAKGVFLDIIYNRMETDGIIISSDYKSYLPNRRLGFIFEQEGNYEEAIKYYINALNYNKLCLDSLYRILILMKKFHSESEMVHFFSQNIINNKGTNFIKKILILALNQGLTEFSKLISYYSEDFKSNSIINTKIDIIDGNYKTLTLDKNLISNLKLALNSSIVETVDLFILYLEMDVSENRINLEEILRDTDLRFLIDLFNQQLSEIEANNLDVYFYVMQKCIIFNKLNIIDWLVGLKKFSNVNIDREIANVFFSNGYEELGIEFYEHADENYLNEDDYNQIVEWLIKQENYEEAYRILINANTRFENDFRFYKLLITIGKKLNKDIKNISKKALELFKESEWLYSNIPNNIQSNTQFDNKSTGSLVELFNKANALCKQNKDLEATEIYLELTASKEFSAVSYFKLGEIFNRSGQVMASKKYHLKAFEMDPNLTQKILNPDHPAHNYIFNNVDEHIVDCCPLCDNQGSPFSSYNAVTSIDFLEGFNPIRLWMRCDVCHHLYANSYPKNLGEILSRSSFDFNLNTNTNLFPIIGNIVSKFKELSPGNRMLEVGVGAGEMSAVAKEFLFDVTGIDIRPVYAENISKLLNIPVYSVDFHEYQAENLFDVICMGDVIEHIIDPVSSIEKASSLLNRNGVLWISTPNFESAFSLVTKDKDPMWRIIEHLNYFSFRSLKKLLEKCNFKIVDYKVSSHYNGSMEVTAVKLD
ncbi:glycosyltransferase [Metabacillus litoralis]|nr:glycosyltransferase [Metabacillus litoralis]